MATGTRVLLLLLSMLVPTHAGASPPRMPTTDEAPSQVNRFLSDSQQWLRENPTHEQAPRVAMDAIILAEWAALPEWATAARWTLYTYHSGSPQAIFAARAQGRAAFADLCLEQFQQSLERLEPRDAAAMLLTTFSSGWAAFGEDLTGSSGYIVAIAVLSSWMAEDPPEHWGREWGERWGQIHELITPATDRLQEASGIGVWPLAAPILLDQSRQAPERVRLLAELVRSQPRNRSHQGGMALDLALMMLPDEEEMDLELSMIRVARAVDAGRWREVSALSEALLATGLVGEEEERQLLSAWGGLALVQQAVHRSATTGGGEPEIPPRAIALLREAGDAAEGAALAGALSRQQEIIEAHVEACMATRESLAQARWAQFSGRHTFANGSTLRWYAYEHRESPAQSRMYLAFEVDGRLVSAVRLEPDGEMAIWTAAGGETLISRSTNLRPAFGFHNSGIALSGPAFEIRLAFAQDGRGLLGAAASWLNHPHYSEPGHLRRQFLRFRLAGIIPDLSQDAEDRPQLIWRTMHGLHERPETLELRLDGERRISGIRFGQFEADLLRYGDEDPGALDPPEWARYPDAPQRRLDRPLTLAEALAVMEPVFSLLQIADGG